MDLLSAVNNACANLPYGYHANIYMENGAGYVELFGPDGREIDVDLADMDLTGQLNEAVSVANSMVKSWSKKAR